MMGRVGERGETECSVHLSEFREVGVKSVVFATNCEDKYTKTNGQTGVQRGRPKLERKNLQHEQ